MTSVAPANRSEYANPSNASARLEESLYLHQFPSLVCPCAKPSRGCPADHAHLAHGRGCLGVQPPGFDPTPRGCRWGVIGLRFRVTSCNCDAQRGGVNQVRLGRCDQQSKGQLPPVPLVHRCDRLWRWHVPMLLGSCSRLGNGFVPCCVWIGVWLRIVRSAWVGW